MVFRPPCRWIVNLGASSSMALVDSSLEGFRYGYMELLSSCMEQEVEVARV